MGNPGHRIQRDPGVRHQIRMRLQYHCHTVSGRSVSNALQTPVDIIQIQLARLHARKHGFDPHFRHRFERMREPDDDIIRILLTRDD